MIVYIGADHRGFALKEKIKETLKGQGYELVDVGAAQEIPGDDYPDYAKLVAEQVGVAPEDARGILLCGSGFGMDITANKFKNVRSALAANPDEAYQARHDDDANVLSIAADFTDEATAQNIVKVFLSTPFAPDERYKRRLEKLGDIESGSV